LVKIRLQFVIVSMSIQTAVGFTIWQWIRRGCIPTLFHAYWC